MTDDFTSDDISQMRKDGDLRAFMRGQFKRPDEKRDFPDAAPPKARDDGRPVGAWPSGVHRPGCPLFGAPDGQCGCPVP